MANILFHTAKYETFWAHYNVHLDRDFSLRMASNDYALILSSTIDIDNMKNIDWFMFSEATSVGLYRFGKKQKIKQLIKEITGIRHRKIVDVYGECLKQGFKNKTFLMVFESVTHLPENHDYGKLKSMFPIIFTWNDTVIDEKTIYKIPSPNILKWPNVEIVPYKNKKILTNISSNKYSRHPLELYTQRRNHIKWFEKKMPKQFDLYGFGWNIPQTLMQKYLRFTVPYYRSYKGTIINRAATYSKYRFALCFENEIYPGWINDKIFDCMRSNCVPIYLGAPNILDYVDKETFIDRRNFSSIEELYDYIINMSEKDYKHYQNAISEFLNSKRFEFFLSTSMADKIASVLKAFS
jgi:hypothetical protein